MAFQQDDIYTVSGGANLFDYWNPFVIKFDSSSFYTWEEDNLPLYDLDERTEYLWEKLGWPTSSVPGLALTVSSSIDQSYEFSANMFTSVQDAIDALPEIIRFPTMIEIAASGDLGEIHLDGIRCTKNGSLEIVNRVFGELSGTNDKFNSTDGYGVARSVLTEDSLQYDFQNTSALTLSANLSSLWADNWDSMWFGINYNQDKTLPNYLNLGLGNKSSDTFNVVSPGIASISVPDVKAPTSNAEDSTVDYSGITGDGLLVTDQTYARTGIATNDKIIGSWTGNYARKVKVSNCDGPIYIRNIHVNAASGSSEPFTHVHEIGFEVDSTNNLVIENCGVARASRTGLSLANSKVIMRRRFFSARNYDTADRGTLEDVGVLATNSKIIFETDDHTNGSDSVFNVGHQKIGIKLIGSEILNEGATDTALTDPCILGVYACEEGISAKQSTISFNGLVDVYNCGTGIKLNQSTLESDSIIAHGCTHEGLDLEGSKFVYNKNLIRPATYPQLPTTHFLTKVFFLGNGQSIKARSSSIVSVDASADVPWKHGEFASIEAHGLVSEANSLPSIDLKNSHGEIIHLFSYSEKQAPKNTRGLHISLENSNLDLRGSQVHSTVITNRGTKSGSTIHVNNNSTLNVAGPTHLSESDFGIVSNNNSVVNFRPHFEKDIDSLALSSWNLSATANHTSVEIHSLKGCLVANNNSVIDIKNLGDFATAYENSDEEILLFPDADAAITSQLSTSGASFAFLPFTENDTSTALVFVDVSQKLHFSSSPSLKRHTAHTVGQQAYNYYLYNLTEPDVHDFRQYSNGGMCVRAYGNSTVNAQNVNFVTGPVNADEVYLDPNQNVAGGCNDLRIWSFGGGSTLNASYLSVSGVYPTSAGYHGPRSTYFDSSSTDPSTVACSAFIHAPYWQGREFDTNRQQYSMRAQLIPWSEYSLESGIESNEAVSALSGVPGFWNILTLSSVATLDQFGLGVSSVSSVGFPNVLRSVSLSSADVEHYRRRSKAQWGSDIAYGFGPSAYENWGPYRLFLEIDGAALGLKYLDLSSAIHAVHDDYDTIPYQTLAQGYFLSGSCSSTASAVDLYFNKLYTTEYAPYTEVSGTDVFAVSGYYHPNIFIRPSAYNILLDESASNTFANAKHCNMPHLDRPSLVNIYRSTTTGTGAGLGSNTTAGYGQGFQGVANFDLDRDI